MTDVHLEPGESIQRSVRKHWFVLFASLLPYAFLAWLPTMFVPFVHFIASTVPHSGTVATLDVNATPLIRIVYGLWLLMLWCFAFNTFTRYYLNQWIVTNTRVIEIHQYGYFSREVSSVLLSRVQDVSSDVEGLFGTLFGYGQLEVESAGEEEHFVMEDIAGPAHLRDFIMDEVSALQPQAKPAQAIAGV